MKVPTRNVGWVERTVRVLLGTQASAGYFFVRNHSEAWSTTLLVVGISLFLTALWGFCPIKRLCKRP